MSEFNNENNTNQQPTQTTQPSKKRFKPKFPWFKTIIVALVAGIIGALIVLGVGRLMESTVLDNGGSDVNEASNHNSGGNTLDGKSDKYDSVNQMINDVSPAIVGVINMQKAQNLNDLLKGKSNKSQEAGVGSGVIYQKNNGSAYIVTNNHVIDGASEIKVQLHNSKQVDAKLIGKDALTDMAVLKINDSKGTKAIDFANSSKVKTGDSVFAMGNPLGLEFANSVTSGIISASERTIDTQTSAGSNKVNVLQTDAAINPGNSGGALVDINGNLVGINSMKIASEQVEGIGFAIPSNEVKVTIKELVENGKIERPSIGIGLLNVSEIPEQYKDQLKTSRKDGVYIAKVEGNNGLKEGDIITQIDDKKVKEDTDVRSYLYANKKPGDTVNLTVERNGKEQNIKVTLKEQKSSNNNDSSESESSSPFN
ncbi:serine protease [Staphylococcus saprophyticus]|jgi:serine protease Do|uniref:Serine protease HtrA-like n=1 Tax=Staphylococcus saprophyticus subsp. saprophyticus (strain ATCC 15305 / DSM 20229 / NCIMB 8711 / NCTC 7292 / S-41) TaxID=342451 RepID=Q49YG1_STAS1|nr:MULTISPECIES: S1C family serine protease [Staphylococcus]SIN58876.1 trypsin-like serine protease with C-terminal PDZ domain [Mycobacteroides abscessus subsp. abscessus]AMG20152.1 serine protease [Staphylococcus saprophyticus]AMG33212.1 serine protease [Staphylococcus saprophyticus]ASF17903.1 serine protease [Staphylococcus saprophyticus]MBC2920599.1 serine protease [Staphylococcus saprophyticus]